MRVYLLAAELQAFSCSYLLFKELAAVKDQAGAHAYAWGEERSGCAGFGTSGSTTGICSWVYVCVCMGPRDVRGTQTLLQMLMAHRRVQTVSNPGCDQLKWSNSWYILKEGMSLFFLRVLGEETPGKRGQPWF